MRKQWPEPQGYWYGQPPPEHGAPGLGAPEGRPPGGNGQRPRFQPPGYEPFYGAGSGQHPAYSGTSRPDIYGTPSSPPSGPPARVGSAVAALIGAVLTLAFPLLFWFLGIPLLALLVNIPGIVFGSMALTKTNDPPEVERFIGYTWACTIVYIGLFVLIIGAIAAILSVI
ncbi:hypothetical protein [Allosalinactinospora lopnorensis]|uniref:hypothetical protein n=1 Tax=Allosalinactinospora lopnorensis TaxID=1352348 RepID=UPI001F16CD7A|nr:hypothetical protein [Allosalinactinospora lopnorensis]